MSEVIERDPTRVALRVSQARNQELLGDLLADYEVVDVDDAIPDDTDLCIVDERAFSRMDDALAAWKRSQRLTYAPVLLLVESGSGNPWERYGDALGNRIDAIQPIPAPKSAIRSRVDSLLETREYSQELIRERQFAGKVFDISPIAKTILDTEGNIVRANERAEAVLGLSESNLSGRTYDDPDWQIIDEDGDPIPGEELPFSRVMETGEPVYGYEHGIEHPDGERVWLSINMAPILDEAGEIEYLVAAIDDVTDRKRLQRELRESEELHRATLSNITDTVFITDEEGRFTYVCPNVHHIFGYTTETVREMGTVDALLGGDPAPGEFANGDTVENIECEVTDVNGETHTVLVTVKSVSIQGGTRLYSARDVTDLVESERELALERERLEAVVENAPLILAAIDGDGEITLSKGRQLQHLGLDPGELNGESILEVFPEVPQIRATAERVLDGEAFSTEIRIEGRVFEAWNQPIFEDGEVDHAVIVAQDITERRRQEERFQAFVEESSDIITVLDRDGTIEYVSPSIERVLGYDPADQIGENVFDIVHPEDRSELVERFAETVEWDDGATITEQFRIRHADGSWRWVESRATRRDGSVIEGYVINTRDVTDRVEAERELRRVNESRSLALTAADAGVWEMDLGTEEVRWHESCERLFGLEPGSFEGTYEAFTEHVHPDDLAEIETTISRAIVEREPFQTTFRIERDDGVQRWMDSRGRILFDDDGEPDRMVGINIDITDRVERERELERYETIIETADDPIYALDADGTITLANEAFAVATGRTKGALIGTDITTLLNSTDVEASLAHIRALAEGIDDPGTLEITLDGPSGDRQYEINVSLLEDGDADADAEDVPGTVGVARDVTELRDRLKQLQVIDRLLRHNLRNDMNIIRGYAKTIEGEAPDPLAEYAQQVVSHSDHLLEQTETQREITRVLATDPQPKPIDAARTIRRTVETLAAEYPEARLDLDLPEEAVISAISDFGRAIEELVINAIRHADREPPEVDIAATVGEHTVEIHVRDLGPGIPETDRRVLVGDYDIDPLHHGSGLGLWLVSWIVRRSDGTLTFEENEPRGTVVTITLPRATGDAANDGEV